MGRRGPDRQVGLLWHKKGGWYRRYDGKPIYFGGGGSVETADERKADREVKQAAHEAWIRYETEHHFGDTIQAVDRAAGRMTGLAATCRLIVDDFDVENTTPEQIEAMADRLRSVSAIYSRQVSGTVQQLATVEASRPKDEGATCQMVVDAYLEYLEKNASDEHYLDAKSRLCKWKQPAKGPRKKPAVPHWLDWVDPKTPIRSLTRDSFIGYRNHLNGLVKHKKTTQSTVNKMFVLVKGAFTAATREKAGHTCHELPTLVKLLKTKKTETADKRIFKVEDVSTMLADFDPKWKAITLISLNCALRNIDISMLQWSSIVWNEKYLNLTRQKQKGTRRTPLWGRTLAALKRWRKESQFKPLVFPNAAGNPYIRFAHGKDGKAKNVTSKNDNLSRSFRRRMKRLQLPHTFATFAKSGPSVAKPFVDGETIEMLLGDASEKVWKKHYVATYPENVAKAVKAIEKHYFAGDK